jgi:hypothetical protein
MILSAEEVRYISTNYYTNNLPYIMKCIKEAAYKGEFSVKINFEVSQEAYNKLVKLGYNFKEDTLKSISIIEW